MWNTRNRGGLEEKRTACFHELSHYVDERRGILQVLRIRETWKQEEYIELIKLLKATRVAESGGMAKQLVDNGEVTRNGEIEYRKRAKIVKGEIIQALGETIKIV